MTGARKAPSEPAAPDHRRIQRALFRMQLDRTFAERVFAQELAAVESTGLDGDSLALLTALDPVAVAADCDDARARQLLGNLATEMPRSVGALTARGGEERLRAFLASDAFHGAIAADASLPRAFAAWMEERAAETEEAGFRALVALEAGMVCARRELRAAAAPGAGEVALARWCHLLSVPDGTLAWAGALTLALESGEAPPRPALDAAHTETLLVQADREPGPSGRRDVEVERLEPAVASLLERCTAPTTVDALAGWAAEQGASRDELAGFVEALVADGVLVAG